jgi:hypothetical protein
MFAVSCRHQRASAFPEIHHCDSPKLVGLKLVSDDLCRSCVYRDHDPLPAPTLGLPHEVVHLQSCLRFGLAMDDAAEHSPRRHQCHHPDHPITTEIDCRTCHDYLFPTLTPRTPPSVVASMLSLPHRPQPDGWWTWGNVQAGFRQAADHAVAQALPDRGRLEGRGIVIVGGGSYFASAYVTIRVLRSIGCDLPIQLWHFEGELTEPMRSALDGLGVDPVDADSLSRRRPYRFEQGHWWKGWQLKPYAIAHSPFREVLFLDADCYPTRNPEYLFEWPLYRERGAIFWPDLQGSAWMLRPEVWSVFGVDPGNVAFESGQVLIDKSTCWRELQLALWYNAHADFVYRHVWGDKDTFNIAWRRLGTSFGMPHSSAEWDTHTILQYGPEGAVLFQHRCQDKFRLAPGQFASTYQSTSENRRNPRLAHEDDCFRYLEELREIMRTA